MSVKKIMTKTEKTEENEIKWLKGGKKVTAKNEKKVIEIALERK